MASKLITLQNLTEYDAKIKELISTEDAKALKTVLWDSTAEEIKFFKKENATLSDTADFAIGVASSDVDDLKTRVGLSTTLNSYNSATNLTAIMNILTGDSSTTGSLAKAVADFAATLGTAAQADVSTSPITADSTDDSLVTAEQVATFVEAEISDLEGAMHFSGVIEREGTETDAEAIARVVTSPSAGDVVVMSDNAKEYIYTGSAWREVGDEGLYVKKSTTIAGVDLQDNITKAELLTALNVADGAQVNVLESVKVNGTALTPDSNKAVDVTVVEGSTDGTVAVNGTDVAVHGLGSAAYTASTAYDAAGTAQAAIEALDSDTTDAGVTGTSGSALGAITGFTFTDGKVSAYNYTTLGSAALQADTYFMKSVDYTLTTDSEIDALFD